MNDGQQVEGSDTVVVTVQLTTNDIAVLLQLVARTPMPWELSNALIQKLSIALQGGGVQSATTLSAEFDRVEAEKEAEHKREHHN